jgi:N6-L-threonylcarbamoyladenine synthase
MFNSTRTPAFPFYSLLISGGHTMLTRSRSLTEHQTLLTTRDTSAGDCLDKFARALHVPWDNKMPGAALEEWSQLGEADGVLPADIKRWGLPRPLTGDKDNVLAFSFTGLRTAVERAAAELNEGDEESRKSLGRAAQFGVFEHVGRKVGQMMYWLSKPGEKGTLVVSGGVASNESFREALAASLDNFDLKQEMVFPPVEFCTVLVPVWGVS